MTDEQMRQSYQQVMALQAEMKSAGAWVFGGRLHEPGTATVARMSGGEVPRPRGRGRLPARGRHGADPRRAGLPQARRPGIALRRPATSAAS
jgi:hypothetical protein